MFKKTQKKIEDLCYNQPSMIETMAKSIDWAVHVINLFLPMAMVIIFLDQIELKLLIIWFFTFQIILGVRLFTLNKIKKFLQSSEEKLKQYMKIYHLVLFVNALSIGAFGVMSVFSASHEYIYLVILLIIGIVSGAVTTLGTTFSLLLAYVLGLTVPMVITLLVSGDFVLGFAGVILALYINVIIKNAYTQFLLIKSSIELQEKYHQLNQSLEKQIKQALVENTKKEKMLQQQTRLAQMGEMISMIAHQWRQPLSAISSSVISLQVKKSSGKYDFDIKEEREAYLLLSDQIHTNISGYVQVLSSTIDDFRNFFKPKKEKEWVALNLPVQRALQIVSSSLETKNIEIVTQFDSKTQILMYQNEMMQVILNIFKNAEDNFVEKQIQSPKLEIYTQQIADEYIITISDNGGGISDEIMPNIFDPYFSTKDEKNGTGLGLYMSKIIVEEHNNGLLSVQNTKDGVCFTISLERVKELG